jgi:hypothetical protein
LPIARGTCLMDGFGPSTGDSEIYVMDVIVT